MRKILYDDPMFKQSENMNKKLAAYFPGLTARAHRVQDSEKGCLWSITVTAKYDFDMHQPLNKETIHALRECMDATSTKLRKAVNALLRVSVCTVDRPAIRRTFNFGEWPSLECVCLYFEVPVSQMHLPPCKA